MAKQATAHGMAIRKSMGDRIFDVCNTIVLLALCFITLYPMWYVICASFTENSMFILCEQIR